MSDFDSDFASDDKNMDRFYEHEWIGLTKDEVTKKIEQLFDDSITYEFVEEFRYTEEMCLNYVEIMIGDNGKVIETRWG